MISLMCQLMRKMAMPVSPETSILLKSYELGVSSVAEDNPKYLSISVKEV